MLLLGRFCTRLDKDLSRASELNIKDDECDISGMDVARVERAGDE
jgi:hypothetical protein